MQLCVGDDPSEFGVSMQPQLKVVFYTKGLSYKAQYPVRRTAQNAVHVLPSLANLFIPTPTRFLRVIVQ